jgi:hypothetical protein
VQSKNFSPSLCACRSFQLKNINNSQAAALGTTGFTPMMAIVAVMRKLGSGRSLPAGPAEVNHPTHCGLHLPDVTPIFLVTKTALHAYLEVLHGGLTPLVKLS